MHVKNQDRLNITVIIGKTGSHHPETGYAGVGGGRLPANGKRVPPIGLLK